MLWLDQSLGKELDEAAHESPQHWAANVVDQRGQVDPPLFPSLLDCTAGELRHRGKPSHNRRCEPRSLHSQPPTWTRINKSPLVAGTVTQTDNEPDSRASTTPTKKGTHTGTFNLHTQVQPDRRAQRWPCQAEPGTMLSDCQHQEPSPP